MKIINDDGTEYQEVDLSLDLTTITHAVQTKKGIAFMSGNIRKAAIAPKDDRYNEL